MWYDSDDIGNDFIRDGYVGGDLAVIGSLVATGGVVRFLRPYKGDIVSAKLLLLGQTPAAAGNTLRVFKGAYNADGVTAKTYNFTNYPEAQRAADWLEITGESAPYTYGSEETVLLDGINILPLIPKRGDADFNEDGFVLGFELELNGTITDWNLHDFKLDCNVRMAKP